MKRLFLVAALIAATVAATPTNDLRTTQHNSEHMIVLVSKDERGQCSATAVAPNVLLTASHCDIDDSLLFVDESKKPTEIVKKVGAAPDALLLVVKGTPFSTWVQISTEEPAPGMQVYWWGNPQGVRDLYRTGYIAGSHLFPTDDLAPGTPVFIVAAPCDPGDSGSNIYAEDGKLLGVLSYGIGSGRYTGFYAIHITPAQLEEAGLR